MNLAIHDSVDRRTISVVRSSIENFYLHNYYEIIMPNRIQISLEANLARVEHLVALYDIVVADNRDADELLRAAVVFLHATLEDFLRKLAGERLPVSDSEFLEKIPFSAGDGKKTKLNLGELVLSYSGRSIEEVVRYSIDGYLSRETYNDTTDIARLLDQVQVDKTVFKAQAESLAGLMKRRHHIVHRVDEELLPDGREAGRPQPIERQDVMDWLTVVEVFLNKLLDSLSNPPEARNDVSPRSPREADRSPPERSSRIHDQICRRRLG